MTTFKQMVEAVEENNRINNGEWKNWETVAHLQIAYGALENGEWINSAVDFLTALIRDNGENAQLYLDAMEAMEYGQVFSGAH